MNGKADMRDQFALIGVRRQVKVDSWQAAGKWRRLKPLMAGMGVKARRGAMGS